MILTVQPDVIEKAMEDQVFRGRGLIGRVLFVNSRTMLGRRKISPPAVDRKLLESWERVVFDALGDTHRGKPEVLTLSPEGDKAREEFQAVLEPMLSGEGRFKSMGDWAGKLVGTMCRIAALLHCTTAIYNRQSPSDSAVTGETVQAASAIAWVLAEHAEEVYRSWTDNPGTRDAEYILNRFVTWGKPKISKGEMLNLCKRFKKSNQMNGALELLEKHNYILQRKMGRGIIC